MLNLPANEMAFRKAYSDLLKQEKITTVFRPGDRDCGKTRGYCPSDIVNAKILEKVGADWAMIPPKFIDGFSKTIVIKTVEVKRLGSLTKKDFEGSSPDVLDIDSLKYQLGLIYNIDITEFNDYSLVTRITFEYKSKII